MKALGLFGILLLAGCAHQKPVSAPPAPEAVAAAPQAPSQLPPLAAADAPAAGASDAVATPPPAPPPPVSKPPQAPEPVRAKPAPSAPAAPRPTAAALPPRGGSAVGPKPGATLDLAALEQRLRDTRAIGVFTKLSLKNQVDDLLDTVREYHSGQGGSTLQDARQRYDSLLVKVLGLLQDGDPALASSIRGSRDAIWNLLADRDQFQKMHL